jgi:hypothetical protein
MSAPEITHELLEKIDRCRHLLPEPGNQAAGQLIGEIRRLRAELAALKAEPQLVDTFDLSNCQACGKFRGHDHVCE